MMHPRQPIAVVIAAAFAILQLPGFTLDVAAAVSDKPTAFSHARRITGATRASGRVGRGGGIAPAARIENSRKPRHTLRTAASGEDGLEKTNEGAGIPTLTFNLIKGCIGSGVLSLPAGVAAIGDSRGALVPAVTVLVALGTISAYTFHLVGRLCGLEGERPAASLGELWERDVGEDAAWLISLSVFGMAFGTCLAYSIILGDTFSSLVDAAGIQGFLATRQANILLITLLAVYPLACLKSLAALAPVSILGIVGILATCLVMTFRALPGGPYSPGGKFVETLAPALRPSFGKVGALGGGPLSLLIVSSMTATAFMVHNTAPTFYNEMRDRSATRFGKLVAWGFGGTTVVSAFLMAVGFLTFGGACNGMILNNYSTADVGATACRLLMGVSLLGSYAFMSNGMKSAFYQLFFKGKEITNKVNYRTTKCLIGILTLLALAVKDVGFVVSFNGALLGSGIIYMIPSYLFLKSTRRRIDEGVLERTRGLVLERWFNKLLIGLGAFLGLAGASVSVMNAFFPHLL